MKIEETEIFEICKSLFSSSVKIYKELKNGGELKFSKTTNESNDEQLVMDIFADKCFQDDLKNNPNVKFILSEERPGLVKYNEGKFSITLDPLDGSKSALVGIPSGAIFGIFENTNGITDFCGKNIVASGFFVFSINLEVYFSLNNLAYKGIWNDDKAKWKFANLENIPEGKMFSINPSNKVKWDNWLLSFYDKLVDNEDENGKSYNMRWYASMVSDIKRLIIQGGLFAYPRDNRPGYQNGLLRLVYEAIPMAYLIKTLGGSSTDGFNSLLEVEVKELHQKTPVFIGNESLISEIENLNRNQC